MQLLRSFCFWFCVFTNITLLGIFFGWNCKQFRFVLLDSSLCSEWLLRWFFGMFCFLLIFRSYGAICLTEVNKLYNFYEWAKAHSYWIIDKCTSNFFDFTLSYEFHPSSFGHFPQERNLFQGKYLLLIVNFVVLVFHDFDFGVA